MKLSSPKALDDNKGKTNKIRINISVFVAIKSFMFFNPELDAAGQRRINLQCVWVPFKLQSYGRPRGKRIALKSTSVLTQNFC